MKSIFLIFCLVIGSSVFSQERTRDTKESHYVQIDLYKKMGNKLTKEDSINFKFQDKDTLVKLPGNFKHPLSAPGIRVAYEFKDPAFLDTYKNVVFYDHDPVTRQKTTLKIWKDDIKVYFESTVPVAHSRELMKLAKELSREVDSLNIRRTRQRGEANFLVYYITADNDLDYEPRITGERKGFYATWNGQQQLQRASLKIDSRMIFNEEDQLENLKVLFFQALGMFYASEKVEPGSLLSQTPVGRKLSPIDKEILKYHYSYGICKGTGLKVFEETHANYREHVKNTPNASLYVVHPYDYFND